MRSLSAGSSPVSRGLSTGIDYEVPWIFDVIGTAEALVVKKSIGSIADLKGKTVATPLASTSHYSLLAALKDAGLKTGTKPGEVNVIDAEPDAIVAAWKAGKIDAGQANAISNLAGRVIDSAKVEHDYVHKFGGRGSIPSSGFIGRTPRPDTLDQQALTHGTATTPVPGNGLPPAAPKGRL